MRSWTVEYCIVMHVCACYIAREMGDEERKAEAEIEHGTFFSVVKILEAHLRMTLQRTPFISAGSLSERPQNTL